MIYKFKTQLICLSLCFSFCTSLCLSTTALALTKIPLVLNDIDWPPFFFNKTDAKLKGVAKEIIDQCLEHQVYQQKFINLPVKRTHLYMKSGGLDISVYSYKKSREDFVIYGKEPLFVSDYGFVVRADSDIDINQLSDLASYKIGHLAGLSHTPEIMRIINDKRPKNQVFDGYNIDDMFKQLIADEPRFDIMINSKETFYWRAKELGITSKIKVPNYLVKQKKYFLTISKFSKKVIDKKAFLDEFDTCIIELKRNGEYKEILVKYGL